MEIQPNIVNQESKKKGLKIHRRETKIVTNFETNQKIEINGIEVEKFDEYKYLGQTIGMEDQTSQKAQLRIHAGWSVFGGYKEIFQDKEIPLRLKRKIFNQCNFPTITHGYH